jgi:glycosyltransferase involved in cell wall biosynthesis
MPKVNVICSDQGWIYSKFISMFRQYSKHQILLNSKDKCDVHFYLPYYELHDKPQRPCTAWFSHQEARKDLHNKFISAAKAVDFGTSHSKKYTDILRNTHGITNIKQILPGVDLHKFQLRSCVRPPRDKLVVGYVGRQYTSSNRKNPQLLNKISQLPFVELKVTGGKIKDDKLPAFYAGLDLVVSPALIEGGPLALQEGLAVGVPFLCFDGVGSSGEFSDGVFTAPYGDDALFLDAIRRIWEDEIYKDYWDLDRMKELRAQIKPFTWARFVKEHGKVWESVI